ncbi:MAG: DEAD/DEAH box helicase family protein [Clostridiales Family XIII bacterium]|jgi:superfamily II DNA or RNA helicase|nr:DEAD/DEAH box helicase family protein [Clostridiales Family XIII bacterium]
MRVKDYNGISFKGSFRSYQQKILDNVGRHLEDHRIHIVAAPGSGKTVLGLELVRRLGKPTLVLSPTIVICQQWGERFSEMFMPDGGCEQDYISNDLNEPRIITSITYQALHSMHARGGDMLGFIGESGIKTVCLYEAHHLKQEWQRALEDFISKLPADITVIALTATPPYDSQHAEWKRYISVCGEIDEEIFVPELVAQGSLCPHQDYVYFNYPTQDERGIIAEHQSRISECIGALAEQRLLEQSYQKLADALSGHADPSTREPANEKLYARASEFLALFSLMDNCGVELRKDITRQLTLGRRLPKLDLESAQAALNLLLGEPEIFGEELVGRVRDTAKSLHLMHRGKIAFAYNKNIEKALVSSLGKLNSIASIAREEYDSLGESLRLLVLTDYIRAEYLDSIGTDKPIDAMGTTPIFEVVRRALPPSARIALVSGSLIVWPSGAMDGLGRAAHELGVTYNSRALPNAGYELVSFAGSNRDKIAVVTAAFQRGDVQAIVGTKALLGEGWDSPCINSLIMASFVGSYVLSNQMRGRAIRIDPNVPDKTANIWHLVSVEPPMKPLGFLRNNSQSLPRAEILVPDAQDGNIQVMDGAGPHEDAPGMDYQTVKRRFECFFGPAYNANEITNGIRRVSIIRPPYDERGIRRINDNMIERAANRSAMAGRWAQCLDNSRNPEVVHECSLPKDALPRPAIFVNILVAAIICVAVPIFLQQVFAGGELLGAGASPTGTAAALLGVALALAVILGMLVNGIVKALSPYRSMKKIAAAVLATLKDVGQIRSQGAAIEFTRSGDGTVISCALRNATVREKHLFGEAISELFSPIDNPRYVLVPRFSFIKKLNYTRGFACPSFVANKATALTLERRLKSYDRRYKAIFTRSKKGYPILRKCRQLSYVNINNAYIKQLMKVV